jgi:hypothetical protein
MIRPTAALLVAFSLLGAMNASAHLSYTNRIFTNITGVGYQTQTITDAARLFGWADGTDADWASQDAQKYFRISLTTAAEVTFTITTFNTAEFIPAFSLYTGLGHQASGGGLDYDGALNTQAYLNSIGGKEGSFDALHDWKIGNQVDPLDTTATLVTFGYVTHAADGTAANYGSGSGIDGDGVLDYSVTKTMFLPAGDYTLVVGGADYSKQTDTATNGTNFKFNATVTVPEPSSALLVAGSLAAAGAIRRRRAAILK